MIINIFIVSYKGICHYQITQL